MQSTMTITDERGEKIEVGTEVVFYEALLRDTGLDNEVGKVVEISDFDGDVDDEGRSISIEPTITVKWGEEESEEYRTGSWKFTPIAMDDEGFPTAHDAEGECEELIVATPRVRNRVKFIHSYCEEIIPEYDNSHHEDRYIGFMGAVIEGEASVLVSAETLETLSDKMAEIDFDNPRSPGYVMDLETGTMYDTEVIFTVNISEV